MTESVVINDFWAELHHGRQIVFHRQGSRCDVQSWAYDFGCGHNVPRSLAETFARPCERCHRAPQPSSRPRGQARDG